MSIPPIKTRQNPFQFIHEKKQTSMCDSIYNFGHSIIQKTFGFFWSVSSLLRNVVVIQNEISQKLETDSNSTSVISDKNETVSSTAILLNDVVRISPPLLSQSEIREKNLKYNAETIELLQKALDENNQKLFDDIMLTRWNFESSKFRYQLKAFKHKSEDLFLSVCAYMLEGSHDYYDFGLLGNFSFYYDRFKDLNFSNSAASKRFISAYVSGKCKDEIALRDTKPLFLNQKFKGETWNELSITPLELDFLIVLEYKDSEEKIPILRNFFLNIFNRIDPFNETDEKVFGKIFDDLFVKIREANKATKEEEKYKFYPYFVGRMSWFLGDGSRNWHNFLVEITEGMLQDLHSEANLKRLLILSQISKDPEFMFKIKCLIKETKDVDYNIALGECRAVFPKLFDQVIPFDAKDVDGLMNFTDICIVTLN